MVPFVPYLGASFYHSFHFVPYNLLCLLLHSFVALLEVESHCQKSSGRGGAGKAATYPHGRFPRELIPSTWDSMNGANKEGRKGTPLARVRNCGCQSGPEPGHLMAAE